jgi:hypothetical protein
MVLPGTLTDLSALVGFCTSTLSRVSNINFDIWIVLGGSYKYPNEKLPTDDTVLSHLGVLIKDIARAFS